MRTLYRATTVRTQSYPEAGEWVLVDGRHVQRVGSGDAPPADRVVDLPGATIVPGFVDAHVHLTSTGISLVNDDVRAARSAGDLIRVARERAAASPSGSVHLMGYDESRWESDVLPSIDELDAACPRPLLIGRADGHVSLANHAALEAASVGGSIGVEHDAEGRPTGVLTREANDAAGRWAMSAIADHDRQDLQLRAASLAASRGVTSVHEMAMPHWHGERDLAVLLAHRDRLPVDASPIVATTHLELAIDAGLGAIGGDLPVDGSIGARTAWLAEPYLDDEGTGSSYMAEDELAGFFHSGHAAGLQVGIHAIGDRAVEQVLTVWERVYSALDSRGRRHFRARRHRIEHGEVISLAQVDRAAMLGLALSVQPAFDAAWGGPGGLYERRLGLERAASMNPFRTMLERGVELGVGSDAPITELDPMAAIGALERHHDPAQRLPRREAIRLHTIGSARIGRQEDKKGALAPGMHADFAAFEVDPFDEPSIDRLRPVLTVSLGREVFAR